MKSNKNLTLEELKELVFEKDQATKANKDKLFKLAKSNNDIETIKRLSVGAGLIWTPRRS